MTKVTLYLPPTVLVSQNDTLTIAGKQIIRRVADACSTVALELIEFDVEWVVSSSRPGSIHHVWVELMTPSHPDRIKKLTEVRVVVLRDAIARTLLDVVKEIHDLKREGLLSVHFTNSADIHV